jgi:hypothetical protein
LITGANADGAVDREAINIVSLEPEEKDIARNAKAPGK